MEEWVTKRLSELLDFPVEGLASCVTKIENERDLEKYLEPFLDNKNPKHRQFLADLKRQRASYNSRAGYKKVNDDDYKKPKKPNEKKKGKTRGKETVHAIVQIQAQVQETTKAEKIEKKKTKFVELYSEGDILLKGRHKCNCEAKRHALVNNCLNCGRIVCKQEGPGPCFFCEELVCYPDQQEILQGNSKQADNLYNKLKDQKPNKDLEDSLRQRDKLLEYDCNSARRTKVIDDDSDYYKSNVWLSATEREKLQQQKMEELACKHASHLDRKIKIDFMGRVVTDEDEFYDLGLEELDTETTSYDFESPNICPTIKFECPTFIEMTVPGTSKTGNHTWNTESRIQDKEYLEMSDQGLCLSMHQPYASLLVAGIKTHEGRNWYTSHRGRLWIASTGEPPSVDEISNIQHIYRALKDENIKFPETYPAGYLLGCVTVIDVLPQEEYRKLYPEGECDSPYVFICKNCYMLPTKFPIKGKHKIYKLDKKLHQGASKCLKRAMKI